MNWEPEGKYAMRSDQDYLIGKTWAPSAWLYEAYGPMQAPGLAYWAWHAVHCTQATRAIGEPTPRRRTFLGAAETAEEVKAICERHAAGVGEREQ